MPKPGPRPYECVRRVWHSDKHKPMRGSLIQEIFRVAHDIHSLATKKNKEWQEKLPLVVLKAEEIMYSKANSEAEYMALETLWDRANDAINTIIRLDATTENGVFLQPCIEAALQLGCTPRRASRSQRNSTPCYYLCPKSPDPVSVPLSSLKKTTQVYCGIDDKLTSSYLDFMRPNVIASHTPAVYPIYNGDKLLHKSSKSNFDTISKLKYHSMELSEKRTNPTNIRITVENSHEVGCDLSLRLGNLGVPCTMIENKFKTNMKDVGSRIPQVDKKSFFYRSSLDDMVDICSSKWSSAAETLNMNKTLKKRKNGFNHLQLQEDKQFFWHPKLPCDQLTGRTSNAGL